MSSEAAARKEDSTQHGDNLSPGPASPDVTVGKKGSWRTVIDRHSCKKDGNEVCYLGSITVLINGQMAVRRHDQLTGASNPNPIVAGEDTVLIGDKAIGLAAKIRKEGFCRAFKLIVEEWETMTADERLSALQSAINDPLTASGVPAVGFVPKSIKPASGQFDFFLWNLDIDESLLNNATLTQAQASELANAIYHEGRHAEQWFHVARYRAASPSVKASQISTDMGIPLSVAEAAIENPSLSGTAQNVLGKVVDYSVYGDQRIYRNSVLDSLYKNSSDETAYSQYLALPEETDAWRTGDSTGGCQ